MIEVIDNTTAPHVCTPVESCDIHRAQRWIEILKRDGYPDKDLEEFYCLFTGQVRILALAGSTIDLYQGALTALTRKAGGMLMISGEEMIPDDKILDPQVDKDTEAVCFRLSSVEKIVADSNASMERAQNIGEAMMDRGGKS